LGKNTDVFDFYRSLLGGFLLLVPTGVFLFYCCYYYEVFYLFTGCMLPPKLLSSWFYLVGLADFDPLPLSLAD